MSKLLSVKDICRELGLAEAGVYSLLVRGEIPNCRVGVKRSRYRVTEEDLAEYLRRTRTPSASAAAPTEAPGE